MKSGASIASVEAGKSAMEILRNVPKSLKAINPHLLLSVPALAANFRKNIEAGIEKEGKTAYRLFRQGLKVAYAYNGEGYNRGRGKRALLKPLVAFYDKMIFSRIRQNFASNLEYFIGGGALLDIELQRFFYAIGIRCTRVMDSRRLHPLFRLTALMPTSWDPRARPCRAWRSGLVMRR